MSTCDFTIGVRIVTADTLSSFDLEDEAAGYVVLNEIATPEWDEAQERVTSPYMHGSAPAGLPTIVDGMLPVLVEVSGSTWAQTCARMDALEAAWRAESAFFLDVELEGVTFRYRAERSLWRPAAITPESLSSATREVSLVFRVQPLPTVTYA